MMFWLGLALGLAIGGYAGMFIGIWRRDVTQPASTAAKSKPEDSLTYGHPLPPLKTLRSRLPKPPLGYAWETYVKHDAAGRPELHLGIIRLSTGESLNSMSKTLDGRLVRDYLKYPSIRHDIFNEDLMTPFLSWAIAEFNRYANANKVTGYGMSAS